MKKIILAAAAATMMSTSAMAFEFGGIEWDDSVYTAQLSGDIVVGVL